MSNFLVVFLIHFLCVLSSIEFDCRGRESECCVVQMQAQYLVKNFEKAIIVTVELSSL